MTNNQTTQQDRTDSITELIAIIVIAVIAIICMFVLSLYNVKTAEFTTFVLLIIPVIVGQLLTHRKVSKVDLQTNGNLTARLDNQTEAIVTAVATLNELPARAYENADK